MRYGPGVMPGKTNRPALLVAVLRSTFVAEPVSVTAAPGMTASDESRTLPRTTLVLACGHADAAASRKIDTVKTTCFTDYLLRSQVSGSVVKTGKHCK